MARLHIVVHQRKCFAILDYCRTRCAPAPRHPAREAGDMRRSAPRRPTAYLVNRRTWTDIPGSFFTRHDSYHHGGVSPSFRTFLGGTNHHQSEVEFSIWKMY